ncbi:hypothetical protein [Fibrella arboris]|uniref:hypothetical protein n=1 Tax=Fibrella arboris TaxID=3242486 RepID=UPI0035229FBF
MAHYSDSFVPVSLVNDDGANAPMRHQQIISRLHVGLGILYYKERTLIYEPLAETMLAEGYGNPVPDVLLFDHATEQTRLIIEVCQTNGQKNDLKKIIRLIEDDDYGILEGFVYNYRTNEWLRYCKGDGGVATASSFSELINLDLAQFLTL